MNSKRESVGEKDGMWEYLEIWRKMFWKKNLWKANLILLIVNMSIVEGSNQETKRKEKNCLSTKGICMNCSIGFLIIWYVYEFEIDVI